MTMDMDWPEAPTGVRLLRAIAAWDAHNSYVWEGVPCVPLHEKKPWVVELWARVADAILSVPPTQEIGELRILRARVAYDTRCALEGRSVGKDWTDNVAMREAWVRVVDAVLAIDESSSPAASHPHVRADHILQFFEYAHLPEKLQAVSQPFCALAHLLVNLVPQNPERTVALRKLLESKDAAVRAAIAVPA